MTSAVNHRYPAIQGELETELETELEDEFETEDEGELEDEFEDEAFLGALGGIARSVGGLLGEGEDEGAREEEYEFEYEVEAELESETEFEDEFEDEAFVNPVQRIYRDAELMAHLARNAAAAEGEEEAEAFIGALVPIAARLIPRAASIVARNAPSLIRGATRIVRRLRRDPATRRLVQAMPVVLQRTAQSLADQAATGRPIDAQTTVRTLARMTGRVLGSPQSCRRALGAVGVFDRRYRRRAQRSGAGTRARVPAYGRRRRAAGRRTTGAVSRARRTR
ncbi:hypothetical protein [Geodermatophilus sp. URMC 64]